MLTPPIPAQGEEPSRRAPLIPDDQAGKAALALRLAENWANNPQLVLIWTTQTEFAAAADAYSTSVKQAAQSAAQRPQTAATLGELDTTIDRSLSYVKDYIAEKFGKANAKSYYAEFGIAFVGDSYMLPRAQEDRAEALNDLVAALQKHQLADRTYGVAFWQPLATQYGAGVAAALATASTTSAHVGAKNQLADPVEEVLSAMPVLVEAQYRDPKARAAKLRELGYLREYNG